MNFWEPFTWKYHLTALSRRRSLDEMKDNKGFGLWIETTTRMFSIPRMPGIFNVGTAIVVSETNVKPWPEWRDEFVRGKDNESVPVLTRKTRRIRARERQWVRAGIDQKDETNACEGKTIGPRWIWDDDSEPRRFCKHRWNRWKRLKVNSTPDLREREKDCDGEKSKSKNNRQFRCLKGRWLFCTLIHLLHHQN